jgi:hypothetical protein
MEYRILLNVNNDKYRNKLNVAPDLRYLAPFEFDLKKKL